MYDIVLAFITAFALSYAAIPPIINVSRKKHLFDEPNHRTSHGEGVPTLGGLGIFAGLIFSIIFWTPKAYFGDLQYILVAIIVLFLIGAKDDIDPVSPFTKLIGQLIASGIVVFIADIRITTLYSIFGVGELPYWLSVVISIFVIISLINAFNLIDGVDGLAGSISVVSSLVFGAWFFVVDEIELAIIAFSVAGSVLAFLRFNISPAKIFMGDTGSLLIGLIASVLAIQFIEINKIVINSPLYVSSAPALAIAILIVPIFDTCRVMFIRIIKGRSPFRPDRQHIHHLLLDTGLNHMQTTLVLILFNVLLITIAFLARGMGTLNLFFLIAFIPVIFSIGLRLYVNRYKKQLL